VAELIAELKVTATRRGSGPWRSELRVNKVARRGPQLTSDQVWRAIARASFAVLSHVTPAGEPRSSGVVYKAGGHKLVVAVTPGGWKARHIAADGRVAVAVPTRRGGGLSLVAPIPPATISFHGTAVVHPAGSPQARSLLDERESLVPAERRDSACVIEITRLAAHDAQPGGVPGARAGRDGRRHAMTARPGDAVTGHLDRRRRDRQPGTA